jgi:hypothetical protein
MDYGAYCDQYPYTRDYEVLGKSLAVKRYGLLGFDTYTGSVRDPGVADGLISFGAVLNTWTGFPSSSTFNQKAPTPLINGTCYADPNEPTIIDGSIIFTHCVAGEPAASLFVKPSYCNASSQCWGPPCVNPRNCF